MNHEIFDFIISLFHAREISEIMKLVKFSFQGEPAAFVCVGSDGHIRRVCSHQPLLDSVASSALKRKIRNLSPPLLCQQKEEQPENGYPSLLMPLVSNA